jgi:hypothetical protein
MRNAPKLGLDIVLTLCYTMPPGYKCTFIVSDCMVACHLYYLYCNGGATVISDRWRTTIWGREARIAMGLLALLERDNTFSHHVDLWWYKSATSFSAA